MKKLMYLALALMIAVGLCACGEGETTAAKSETTAPTENETTAPIEDATTAPEPTEHTHDYQETVVTKATCTENGMMFLKCKICGDSDYKEIPATGHTEVIDEAVAPTCTATGLTEGKHCSVCDKILVKQEVVAKIAHEYEQQICKTCGKHEFLYFGLNEDGDSYYVSSIAPINDEVEIIIPEKYKGLPVTGIGNDAFFGCSSLTSIEIPNSVTSIGDHAFSDCSSLTSIEIPNSVTSIGVYAFHSCSSLTSIEIPNSVTSIGVSAFECCNSLTVFYYDGTYEQWITIKLGYKWINSEISYIVHCTDIDLVYGSWAYV